MYRGQRTKRERQHTAKLDKSFNEFFKGGGTVIHVYTLFFSDGKFILTCNHAAAIRAAQKEGGIMKRCLKIAAVSTVVLLFTINMALAQDKKTKSDRQKFGADNRIEEVKNLKVDTRDKKHRWKMVHPWSQGLLFNDKAVHFCDTVRLASGGRLEIKA